MGMQNSKFGKEIPNGELQEASLPSTPNAIKTKELDPRSPSLHIARTPLELLSAAAEKLESYDCDTPLRNKHLLLGVDPRSPTTDFKRTPIILNDTEGDLPRKLHNKNLDKARLSEISTSIVPVGEKKTAIPPKLLESSPIKRRSDAYKRRSLVGLLETNMDFTETDLDKVMSEKCKIETTDTTTLDVNLKDNGSVEEDAMLQTEECDSVVIDSAIVEEISKNEQIEIFKVIEMDQISVIQHQISEVVEHDHISETVEKNKVFVTAEHSQFLEIIEKDKDIEEIKDAENEEFYDSNDKNDDSQEDSNDHNNLATDEDKELSTEQLPIPNESKSAPPSPEVSLNAIVHKKEVKSEPVTPPFVNLTADVKLFDKKLQNLIYEDYDVVVCPRIVKLKENVERSPLRNCNGNEPKPKSAQNLKVSDKPRRSDYAVSKIPVFKEKRSKFKNEVQCENTPPTNMDSTKVKVRKTNWDTKDNTLYL